MDGKGEGKGKMKGRGRGQGVTGPPFRKFLDPPLLAIVAATCSRPYSIAGKSPA